MPYFPEKPTIYRVPAGHGELNYFVYVDGRRIKVSERVALAGVRDGKAKVKTFEDGAPR